jgi:hypothetical protein
MLSTLLWFSIVVVLLLTPSVVLLSVRLVRRSRAEHYLEGARKVVVTIGVYDAEFALRARWVPGSGWGTAAVNGRTQRSYRYFSRLGDLIEHERVCITRRVEAEAAKQVAARHATPPEHWEGAWRDDAEA